MIQLDLVIIISIVNEHLVITNRFLRQIGNTTTNIKLVITKKNYRSRALRYNRV
jgi:hypothetical protein